jgi:hypothetical protein
MAAVLVPELAVRILLILYAEVEEVVSDKIVSTEELIASTSLPGGSERIPAHPANPVYKTGNLKVGGELFGNLLKVIFIDGKGDGASRRHPRHYSECCVSLLDQLQNSLLGLVGLLQGGHAG